MTVFFVALLAGLWGVVFLPVLLRAREHTSPITSVNSFSKGLQALGSGHAASGGRWVVMPPCPGDLAPRKAAIERRRRIFTWLIGAAVASLAFGMLPGLHGLLWIHVIADVLLGAFVGCLIRCRNMSLVSRAAASRPLSRPAASTRAGSSRPAASGTVFQQAASGVPAPDSRVRYPAGLPYSSAAQPVARTTAGNGHVYPMGKGRTININAGGEAWGYGHAGANESRGALGDRAAVTSYGPVAPDGAVTGRRPSGGTGAAGNLRLDMGMGYRPGSRSSSYATGSHEALIVRPASPRAEGRAEPSGLRPSGDPGNVLAGELDRQPGRWPALDFFRLDEEEAAFAAGGAG